MWKKRKTKHHRKPLAASGTDDWDNISLVTEQRHRAFHLLYAAMSPSEIARELTRTWIDPDFVMVAVHRKKGVTVGQILELGNEVNRNETTFSR